MKGLTILAYHRVHPARRGALCVTPGDLERQMGLLLERGMRPIGGIDLIRALGRPPHASPGTDSPRPGAPPPHWRAPASFPGGASFLVTFDDGYADVAHHAWPVLRRLGVPAVVFLIHDWVGRGEPLPWERRYLADPGLEDRPLDWDEVAELARQGCEFGSHTLTHPDLDRVPEGQAHQEIAGSRQRLRERVGREVPLFCYPRGVVTPALAAIVARAGYTAAVITPRRAGLAEHRYCLRRTGVYAADRGWRYRLKVSPASEFLREARLRWSFRKPACFS
jgi:peptidoglycan/xylan/chitin deacetylase (PgdA/CDA1 family)